MNEFTAKKLGEVLAFSRVGQETMDKARGAHDAIFGKSLELVLKGNKSHGDAVERIAESAGVAEITAKKLEGTGAKLRKMREIYLASPDDWGNPSEILEWMGFFEGAAFIHWKLVQGAASAFESSELQALAAEAAAFHERLLSEAGAKLSKLGRERAA